MEMDEEITEAVILQFRSMLKAIRDPLVLEELAGYTADLRDALMKKGFTPDQALQIICSNPLGGKK